jgi:hypothetical protein
MNSIFGRFLATKVFFELSILFKRQLILIKAFYGIEVMMMGYREK